ncbi:MAG: selenocysteine-specific translation elongation factor [Nocardioidaceae bacterium]
MHVIATAGHVDHGKSTLVRTLTGADPDRLSEEHRRGLSIELGYCWTHLAGVGEVAFVDVPGHERFISTMLAGVGPVPAVLFVVAADDPWMPQAAEHLAALDALGVEHGVVAITRSDLADPATTTQRALARLRGTSLHHAPAIAVSARTGAGIEGLRRALVELVRDLDVPDPTADVRLWVDRCFHVVGAGTVVTGTLTAGTIRVGDTLSLGSATVRVRGIQTLERPVTDASGVARVALSLGGNTPAGLERGCVLVTPDAWLFASTLDVRTSSAAALPERPMLHVGATSASCRCRPLSEDLLRLTLDRPLPLRVGDRVLLRNPGDRKVWGATVLDPRPPALNRRGSARDRAEALAASDGRPDARAELRRRGPVSRTLLRQIGADTGSVDGLAVQAGDWLLDAELAAGLGRRLRTIVEDHDAADAVNPGVPVAAAAHALGLPTPELVAALVAPPLWLSNGRVRAGHAAGLPPQLDDALARLGHDLANDPFAAPTAGRLTELGLDAKAIGAAIKAGRLLRISGTLVLLPGADAEAARRLSRLPQPFTTSRARMALATSRRVALPLLAHLDRLGWTRRLPDDRRTASLPPAHGA